jgi:large subunit ribosomal protein L31
MKVGIHPKYETATVVCSSCGNTFETRSTKSNLRIDLCNLCHPFYTGEQRIVDTAGQVERFMKKLETASVNARPTKRQVRITQRQSREDENRRRAEEATRAAAAERAAARKASADAEAEANARNAAVQAESEGRNTEAGAAAEAEDNVRTAEANAVAEANSVEAPDGDAIATDTTTETATSE